MKLWRGNISYMDGIAVAWASSKRQCERDAAWFASENEGTVLVVRQVDVPIKRSDLVDWLNLNLGMDNG